MSTRPYVPRPHIIHAALAVLAAGFFLGCGDGAAEGPLAGAWVGQDSAGSRMGLVFQEGGTVLWIADRIPGVQDTTALRFRVDTAATPGRLDITGFMSGPYAGMTLFGIYQLQGRDTLRYQYEPGIPGGATTRPDSLGTDAMVFTRAE